MYIVNESERKYDYGDSGPKYLMRGPHLSCGVVVLKPGQDFTNHYLEYMEENFLILEGSLDFYINNELVTCKSGQLIHLKPTETHYLKNNYTENAKAIFILGPLKENDKFEVAKHY